MRVMTYNILTDGRNFQQDPPQPERWDAIAAVIKAVDPDVVVLQEVMTHDFLTYVANVLGMAWFWADDGGKMQVGALSRLPVQATTTVSLHFSSGAAARSALALTVLAADGQPLTIYGVHAVAFYSWVAEAVRRHQIKHLLAHAAHAHPRHLLIGDFNTFAPNDTVSLTNAPQWVKMQTWPQLGMIVRWALKQIFVAGYIDTYRHFHPDEYGYTLPSPQPAVRLDYIFAAPPLAPHLKACDVIHTPDLVKTASDHRPLLLELAF